MSSDRKQGKHHHYYMHAAKAPQSTLVVCSVMHADEKDVKAAMKKQPNKGGIYFPIAAVQVRPLPAARAAHRRNSIPSAPARAEKCGQHTGNLQLGTCLIPLLPFPTHKPQKFDANRMDFENGVFLGPLAHLTFNGPYAMSGRQLTFDVSTMNIGLGPLKFSIPLKKDAKSIPDREAA